MQPQCTKYLGILLIENDKGSGENDKHSVFYQEHRWKVLPLVGGLLPFFIWKALILCGRITFGFYKHTKRDIQKISFVLWGFYWEV